MEYQRLLSTLDDLLLETYNLWEPGWVTFNWRAYTYDHVQRVRGLAVHLCREEGGDAIVIELAAILHDITKPYDGEYVVDAEGKRVVNEAGLWRNATRRPARSNAVTKLYDDLGLDGQLHNESGATLAYHLLKSYGVSEDICQRVAETIRQHLRPSENAEIESRCLYDADTIDANIGLPAFVRNIYINLHFHDVRKKPETPPLQILLRDGPMAFLRPYVLGNLPNWAKGKRRDFCPRLLTEAGRSLSQKRLDRLDGVFNLMAEELDNSPLDHPSCLRVVLHYMQNNDEPSMAQETRALASSALVQEGGPRVQEVVHHLEQEMAGAE